MTAEHAELLRQRAAAWGVSLDPAAVDRLGRFLGLLRTWNRRIRLTGERDEDVLVSKHTLDSLAPVRYLPVRGLAIDIGSGGGFPGIILGCVRPDLELVLLDARRRPVSFLREVVRGIPLPRARALQLRIEDAVEDVDLAGRAELVIARALGVELFLTHARTLLAPDGIAVAMQTPRGDAVSTAQRHGMILKERFDYRLAAGEHRTLLVFAAGPSAPRKSARPVS
jgi:16S rRNA (guanine527-N7)-methyltransferase